MLNFSIKCWYFRFCFHTGWKFFKSDQRKLSLRWKLSICSWMKIRMKVRKPISDWLKKFTIGKKIVYQRNLCLSIKTTIVLFCYPQVTCRFTIVCLHFTFCFQYDACVIASVASEDTSWCLFDTIVPQLLLGF